MENTEGWEIETWSVYMLNGAFISHFLLPFFFSDDHNKNILFYILGCFGDVLVG